MFYREQQLKRLYLLERDRISGPDLHCLLYLIYGSAATVELQWKLLPPTVD